MIGYVTLGTNDFIKATEFYDALLAELGGSRFMESDSYVAWSPSPTLPGLAVIKPFDGSPATVGNGVMVALSVESPNQVDDLYKKAMELGASDEGKPGKRGEGSFYAAYFRDLDGNKLNVYCIE